MAIKLWHLVRDSSCGADPDDPEALVWTVSLNPNETGWETDSGQDGYGLTLSQARELADAANHARDLIEAESEDKLEDTPLRSSIAV